MVLALGIFWHQTNKGLSFWFGFDLVFLPSVLRSCWIKIVWWNKRSCNSRLLLNKPNGRGGGEFQKSHKSWLFENFENGRIFGSRNAALYWRIPPLIIMQWVHYARDYAEFNLDHPAPPFTPTTALNLRLRSRGNVLDCGIGRSPHKYNCTNVQVIIM